ncbi:response regulator [Brevibacterium marinum]|uniref:DNA-binding NarL/FixJ family response regulator n=1 Tax=Brevibacterium marinum TaxID=418643 RepID=A0A846S0D7_9MICO|nr:DNA-binding NarL/FixJ family response regulator [Brevibacterium marinum]
MVAEDSALMRDGLITLLERFGHDVCASVDNAGDLAKAAKREEPQLVITDVRMPPDHNDDGLRAALDLRQQTPGSPVLVLSQYVEKSYAMRLLDSGDGRAVGYLLKDRVGAVTDFVDAAEQVASGGTVFDPDVIRQLLVQRGSLLARLTARESEVLYQMAQGRSNAAIARELVVTDAAINKHIGNIFAKLELSTTGDEHRRVAAVLEYLRS